MSKPELRDFDFNTLLHVPDTLESQMQSRLRHALPEHDWEDLAEHWGKIRIVGTTRELPHRVVVCISRNEPPGPLQLNITARSPDAAEAKSFHIITRHRVQLALYSRLVDPSIPDDGKARPPFMPPLFSFESCLEVDEAGVPGLALRIKNALPELVWEERAEHPGQVRLIGQRNESTRFAAVYITRTLSSGPFQVRTHLWARSKTDAHLAQVALLSRIQSALQNRTSAETPINRKESSAKD